MKNNLFIISGPSGAGEDSVIEGLRKYFPLKRVITTTTRKARPGDSQGNPYYFISEKEFADGLKKGNFFESAKQYNGQYYGVTNKEIEKAMNSEEVVIWKLEYQGVIFVKKKMPQIKTILISAPLDVLEERIRKRGGIDEESIKKRMEYTKKWYKYRDIYDYEVVNEQGKMEKTIKKIAEIIKKHKDVSNDAKM